MVDDFGPDFDEEGNPLEEGESDRIKDEEERQKPSEHVGDDETGSQDGDSGKAPDEGEAETQAEQEEAGTPA
jgi:F-type H+-transporting ATPase subunit alpha